MKYTRYVSSDSTKWCPSIYATTQTIIEDVKITTTYIKKIIFTWKLYLLQEDNHTEHFQKKARLKI